jgi:aldehyde dehydrogenase (NAD+)
MDIVRRAAGRGVPVQAEMGGHNAAIVLADADLDFAATTIAHSAMNYAGQKCTATRRVVVVRAVSQDFVPRLAQAVDRVSIGMPEDEATDLGPVISSAARESIRSAIASARKRGARQLTSREDEDSEGWFVTPQLLEIDDPADDFAQKETFGPVASVLIVDTEEEALAVANATDFGLVGSVFTEDVERGRRLATQLDAGLQRVNAPTTGTDFYVPFGGEKASSFGPREQGNAAREFFTHTRTLLVHSGR